MRRVAETVLEVCTPGYKNYSSTDCVECPGVGAANVMEVRYIHSHRASYCGPLRGAENIEDFIKNFRKRNNTNDT